MTDKIFSDSVRKAIQDFGEDIILDRRLIGILKDYQAFSTLPPAEPITKLLIESGTIYGFYNLKNKSSNQISDLLHRTVASFKHQYGFSEDILHLTINSILDGAGIEEPTSEVQKSTQNQPSFSINISSEETEEGDASDEDDHRYSFSEIRRKLKKIISIKYGIPRRDIDNDNTLEELEDISTDIIDTDELIEEIEDEFEVFLDADLIDEYMTINELTKEIRDMMDD